MSGIDSSRAVILNSLRSPIGKFQGASTISTTGVKNGIGIVAGSTSSTAVVYYPGFIFRFPN